MKLRLTEPGFETYTGQMGVIFFEDGLSTADVRPVDGRRMGGSMLCEWEDGSSPNVAQSILDNQDTAAPMGADTPEQKDAEAAIEMRKEAIAEFAADAANPDRPAVTTWTREQLSVVADKEGIKGLRAIAEPLGIKGTSIRDLIDAIMLQQHGTPDTPDFS